MSRRKKEVEFVALDLRVRKTTNPRTKVAEEIPDLDPVWMEDMHFVLYIPPPVQPSSASAIDPGSMEEWIERMTVINDDLKWLLCLPHSKFWCQVIFDQSLQQCLDSYLRLSQRNYDVLSLLSTESLELRQNVHKRVFMAYLRMSTHKESKMDFLTPSTFGDILYENFLFDIPKLMDICALYGGEESANVPLLTKMMENIFSKQPKYYDDLFATIPSIYQTMDNILSQCGLETDSEDPAYLPQKLSDGRNNPEICLSNEQLEDIVFYLHDTVKTLSAFVCAYTPLCFAFHKQGFVQRTACFYEAIVPYFCKHLRRAEEVLALHQTWRQVKMMLVKLCHILLFTCCIEPTSKSTDEQTTLLHIEDYLQVMTSVLSEKRFLSSYNARFSIKEELAGLHEVSQSMDETRVDYILAAVESAGHLFPSQVNKNRNTVKQNNDVGSVPHHANSPVSAVNHHNTEWTESVVNGTVEEDKHTGAASRTVSDVELVSMVTHVQDLLPDLGDGFVMRCLEELNYNVEQVINQLLEDNLPLSLQQLNRTMTREEATVHTKQEPKTFLEQRHSVYDNDEFDVFSGNKIDVSKVHKGKRRDRDNLKTLLADKSHITDAVKDRYSAYDVFGKLKWSATLYDDEYDDTYDSQNVGAEDADSADERVDKLTFRRPFTTPRVLGGSPVESEDEDGESDEENTTAQEMTENESGRTSKQGMKGSAKDQNPENRKQQGKGRDREAKKDERKGGNDRGSKGAQRGRGRGVTDAELRKRAYNERNKGTRANHNRKMGAERKRNKGMGLLPSH